MLRLFSSRGFHDLCKCSHFVSSCVKKKDPLTLLHVRNVSHHRQHMSARLLHSGSPAWKDALQPTREKLEEIQTIDLDKWKSVMRSQAVPEEKQQVSDDEEEAGGDSSSLEATRDLVSMWRQAGKLVPQEMTDEEVQNLAQLTTKSARKKYLKYLAVKEGHKKARREQQQKKKAEREAALEQRRQEDGGKEEGDDEKGQEAKNTMFLQYWSRSLDKLLAWRSAQAMLFGQPLVFDMSYESHMSRREVENTVSQLLEVEGWNRRATDPFHLHFCNLQADSRYKQELVRRYGAEAWDRLLITSTERQYVDIFPHEQLVYLTADSPNVLRKFDHSKVYIIGALVDRSVHSGLSLANAKRLKLATARLPLDEFLNWEMGGKNLTLDQMIRIMINVKDTGKWEEALQFVPQRKHGGFHQTNNEITKHRVRGVTNNGLSVDGDRRVSTGERTFKNEGLRLNRPHKESVFSGRDRMGGLSSDRDNKPFTTRVRTSLKSNMERRESSGRNKMWWNEE